MATVSSKTVPTNVATKRLVSIGEVLDRFVTDRMQLLKPALPLLVSTRAVTRKSKPSWLRAITHHHVPFLLDADNHEDDPTRKFLAMECAPLLTDTSDDELSDGDVAPTPPREKR